MSSENSDNAKPHLLTSKLTDKWDLRRVKKTLIYQILVFTVHRKT